MGSIPITVVRGYAPSPEAEGVVTMCGREKLVVLPEAPEAPAHTKNHRVEVCY